MDSFIPTDFDRLMSQRPGASCEGSEGGMRIAQGWQSSARNVQSDRKAEEGEIPEQFHGGWTVPA